MTPYRVATLRRPQAPAVWWPRHLAASVIVSVCTAIGHESIAAGVAEFVVLLPLVALVANTDRRIAATFREVTP